MNAKRNVSAAVAALSMLGAVAAAPVSAQADESSRAAPAWKALGKVGDRTHQPPVAATSKSGVLALVAAGVITFDHPKAKSLVVLRRPGGDRVRARVDIGELVGVAVDRRGNTTVIGNRRGDTVALTWRRHRAHPTLKTLLPEGQVSNPYPELQRNGAGDLAVIVIGYPSNGRAAILRKPDGSAWQKPVIVTTEGYGARLDDASLRSDGAIVGAFQHDDVMESRTLPASGRTFGDPEVLIEWPEISETPNAYGVAATIDVGAKGDLVASLSYVRTIEPPDDPGLRRDVEAGWYKILVLPRDGDPWQLELDQVTDPVTFHVDAAGDMTMDRGGYIQRWTPETRELATYNGSYVDAWNPRGDLLLSTKPYGGVVSLWPSGGTRGPAVPSPRGDFMSAFLGQDRVAHVTTLDRKGADAGSYLWRRQF